MSGTGISPFTPHCLVTATPLELLMTYQIPLLGRQTAMHKSQIITLLSQSYVLSPLHAYHIKKLATETIFYCQF
ncbi:hypothetical protein [Nostoc sp.]|uniref:hypothetical protein n=1 Tax=Nostoc sp. TaxID=1180 RepID=UPI002FF643FE